MAQENGGTQRGSPPGYARRGAAVLLAVLAAAASLEVIVLDLHQPAASPLRGVPALK